MFYLTMHSTHFIYGYMALDPVVDDTEIVNRNEGRKEMFLFNDSFNTFYFKVIWHQSYGKGSLR